jgi:phenylalanyl-tRNA synthetase beta chain
MKLPLSWLREWIEFEATPEGVAEALTTRGFYVEDIEARGATYPGVVVARVLEVQKHPNADKLSLCRVDGGAGELRVVCGAPNVKAGMWVPLANVGAKLPGGVAIKKSKIRGEESQGMLCSPRELELSDDHEGILDLERWLGEGGHDAPATLRLGRPFEELGEPPDTILEIEIPFNRPDGMGVLGLAREARAALGGRWTAAAGAWRSARWRGRSDFDLELEDREGCPRYIAQCVEDVQVGPSPAWIRRRLESAGQRSINNIVDITNLVLLEFGQPLHAFDFDRLAGRAIRVRRAAAGESIVTLDDKQRALDPEVLVIADRERPVAVAGVMGGRDSEVSERTTSLLLECAWFDPTRVRRGSRRLGLSTEASKRYERGVDPDIGSAAAARFLALLKDVSPAARPTQAPPHGDDAPGAREPAGRHRTGRGRCAPPARSARVPGGVGRCVACHRAGVAPGRAHRGGPDRGGRALARLRQDPRGSGGRGRGACRARTARADDGARAAGDAGARTSRGDRAGAHRRGRSPPHRSVVRHRGRAARQARESHQPRGRSAAAQPGGGIAARLRAQSQAGRGRGAAVRDRHLVRRRFRRAAG